MNPGSSNRPSRRTVVLAFAVAIAAAAGPHRRRAHRPQRLEHRRPTATPVVDLDGIPQDDSVLGIAGRRRHADRVRRPAVPGVPRLHRGLLPDASSTSTCGRARSNTEFRGFPFIGADSVKALPLPPTPPAEQDKLWKLQEALYRNQGGENDGWVTDDLDPRARGGDPRARRRQALRRRGARRRSSQEAEGAEAAGQAAGIQGTPTFLDQDRRRGAVHHPGRHASTSMRAALDDALDG